MKLYDVSASANSRRVRVLCRELQLPVELESVNLTVPRSPSYLENNPTGKVPTLVDDDGTVIWESGAILLHLAERRPEAGLLPAEARPRAEVFRWMFFCATHVQPWLSVLGQERLLKPRLNQPVDEHAIALAERELSRYLHVLDAALEGKQHLVDGCYSLADVFLGCSFEGAEARGVDVAAYPNVFDWRERLRRRVAWAD